MTTICQPLLLKSRTVIERSLERIEQFAIRWHIDVSDDIMAPRKLIPLDNLWWPANVQVDHMMYKNPSEHLDLLIAQHPRMVIIHAEADGDFDTWADALCMLTAFKSTPALRPDIGVDLIASSLPKIDHVLIFSGNIGYQGGSHADLKSSEQSRAAAPAAKPLLKLDGMVA